MTQAIAFERVRFAYPRKGGETRAHDVLIDLDLAVPTGETLALVGRSGAGKSTLLHLVNRLDDPTAGRLLVDGRDTREWDPIQLRRHVGFVLQHVGLFPHLTVARNIGLLPGLDGWTPARVDARVQELLQLVGLTPDHAGRWPDELSGGQQQRVGVARALALDPPILLMDEPFGALDPLTRLALHREFRRIQSTLRKTVIIVTHDMREAFALATRVGVIDEGRLVAIGTRGELLRERQPFVRELLATLEVEEADGPQATPGVATAEAGESTDTVAAASSDGRRRPGGSHTDAREGMQDDLSGDERTRSERDQRGGPDGGA